MFNFFFWRRPVYKLHVFQSGDGWYFHAKAANGEIVFPSQRYETKDSAQETAEKLTRARLVLA